MPRYVVNNRPQSNGDHDVHKQGCAYFPSDYTELGQHESCATAVTLAKRILPRSNGCAHCSAACHTS